MCIRAGYPLTNPQVVKSLISEGLNGPSSESGFAFSLTKLLPEQLFNGLFDNVSATRLIFLVYGSLNPLSDGDATLFV